MSGFLGVVALVNKIIDLILFALREIPKKLAEWAVARQLKQLGEAIARAREAKTTDEKQRAACELEKTFNPDSDCSTEPRK